MKKLLFLSITVICFSCNQAQETVSETATLLSDVTIVDVRTGSLLENRFIVVDSGKIKKVLREVKGPNLYSKVIAGSGKFAVPGLAEMHAHIPSPNTSQKRIEETLFLYLSNGITTIRGMLGHPAHLELREKSNSGKLLSPRIFTSSPSLNGNSVPNPEVAREKVVQYQKEGYDFLKIHPGISREAFDELVATANEVGITFAGHVPVDVGIRHALKNNYASIDHVDGFLEGLVPPSKNVDPAQNGFFGYNFSMLADTTLIRPLVALAKENKVWIVPTQSLFTKWFAPANVDTLLALSEMKYMPKATLENWRRIKEETMANPAFNEAQWNRFDQLRKMLIKALQDQGHGMLLGSDAPQLFNVPGFSIHKEMQDMEEAGLSRLEVLRSGTINPAQFFEMEDTFGAIEEGLDADILLLGANPLEDLSALKKLEGVMVRGTWIDRETLDQQLKIIAENAAK